MMKKDNKFRIEYLVILAILLTTLPLPASALIGTHPWAVVLCKFNDSQTELQTPQYFQDMFTVANNPTYQYWKDISYGKLDLSGTIVVGNHWYTINKSKADFETMSRETKVQTCKNAAAGDADFSQYYGTIAIVNGGFGEDEGAVRVGLGAVLLNAAVDLSFVDHEMGHSLGLEHSRSINYVETQVGQEGYPDYQDCYDIMSAYSCVFQTTGKFPDNTKLGGGPGLNAIYLDKLDWRPLDTPLASFVGGTCGNTATYANIFVLAPLNHPEAGGFTDIHATANLVIPPPPGQSAFAGTTADRYFVEFRDKSGWDAGIARDTVLLHARGQDGLSYLVDNNPLAKCCGPGEMLEGAEYVDYGSNFSMAVNEINSTNRHAIVSISSPTCPMRNYLPQI